MPPTTRPTGPHAPVPPAARRELPAPSGHGLVLSVGETMVQLTPGDVPLDEATSLAVTHGGCESNVAVWLARAGLPAAWLSRLGTDPFGDAVATALAAEGVDVHAVRDPDRPTGLYAKDPGPAGTRVHYRRTGSAATALTPEALDAARRTLAPAALLTSGVTAALSASCRATVEHLLSPAGSGGALTVLDVNHRPALWPDLETAAGTLARLADAADVVLVGLDEAERLWGTSTPEDVRRHLPHPLCVVVKDSGRRAVELALDGTATTVDAPAVDVVEPVGAGDAFAAGWLAGWVTGQDETTRLRLGHLLAGAALRSPTDHGPLPAPLPALLAASSSAAPWPPAPLAPTGATEVTVPARPPEPLGPSGTAPFVDRPTASAVRPAGDARAARGTRAGSVSTELFGALLTRRPVLAILRGLDPDRTCALVARAADAGLAVAEVPVTGEHGWAALEAAVRAGRQHGVVVGAGTVLTPDDAVRAHAVGAAFTVAPGLDADVVRAHSALGLAHLPGVATASEVSRALALGLTWQKAFPASTLGPAWFSALAAPFPQVRWVATGGVDADDASDYLAAGAAAVALGTSFATTDPAALRALVRGPDIEAGGRLDATHTLHPTPEEVR